MPTDAYVEDVVALASALIAVPALRSLISDPESAVLDEFGPLPEVRSLTVTVEIPSRDYTGVTATQQFVQLAIDSAAIAYALGSNPAQIDSDRVRGQLADAEWGLTIEELGLGSVHQKITVWWKSPQGKKQRAVVAVLVGAALTISGVGLAAAGAATAIVTAVNIAGVVVPLATTDWKALKAGAARQSVDLGRIPVGVQINVVAENRYEVSINVRGPQRKFLDFYNLLIHWEPPFSSGRYSVDPATVDPREWHIVLHSNTAAIPWAKLEDKARAAEVELLGEPQLVVVD